jgi:hypothetical protein
MADTTYGYTPGSGALASIDRITGTDYPHYKLKWGVAGTVTDVSAANPLPVTSVITGTPTVTANVGTGTQPVSGTVSATQSGTWNVGSITTMPAVVQGAAGASAWKVDGSAVTQPISGTVTANVGTGLDKGTGAATATTLRATIDTSQLGTLIGGAVPVVNGGLTEFIVGAGTMASTSSVGIALETGTGSGAVGDMLDHLVCVVEDPATCEVYVRDGPGSMAPGHLVLPTPLAAGVSVQHIVLGGEASSPGPGDGWWVATGAGVTVRAYGTFS